jgi:hypothetical protein
MKRIACCCTLSLLILLLLVGCIETKQKTNIEDFVITHATTTLEMTAAPTPRNFDADNVIPALTPRNSDADNMTPTPRIFDVDDVNMQSTPESSCFSEIGYDSDWEVLVVRFRDSGLVYTYSGFPEGEWIQFIAADSLGRWYNAHIKGQYEYEKING